MSVTSVILRNHEKLGPIAKEDYDIAPGYFLQAILTPVLRSLMFSVGVLTA